VKNDQELEVWQRAVLLAERAYRETTAFPPEERFGLTSQTRRAAVSVAANIAEGWGRGTTADYIWFLTIARGSLTELETHLILANRLSMLPQPALIELQQEVGRVGMKLNRLITSLKAKHQQHRTPKPESRIPYDR
jgi:four helix bundle protein